MSTKSAAEFLLNDLSQWTTELRYEEPPENDEALLVFNLSYDNTVSESTRIPNSAVYISEGYVKEFDLRFGSYASNTISVEDLEMLSHTAAQEAGHVDVQRVDNGGRMNKTVLHVRSYNTMVHPDEFCIFIDLLCQRVESKLAE